MTTAAEPKPRFAYMDALRIVAAFLVIVNHTNSYVFKAATPGAPVWWASMAWYAISKIAVPVFVMISGACLLGKVDSYRKVARRALRALAALLAFSYLFYLYDAWVYHGLWPRAVDLGAFFTQVWSMQIMDDLWYLYMYIGLMLMLPLTQRLASAMRSRDMLYLVCASFALNALLPLAAHYAPALAPPKYFYAPMFAVYIGLFFAGRWLNEHLRGERREALWGAAALVISVAAFCALNYRESFYADKYWFLDDRAAPSIFTIVAAAAAFAICKAAYRAPISDARSARLRELGGCAFGVYLWQGFLVAQTRRRLFEPLCGVMPDLLAAIVWELAVFAAALALTWLMRRVPCVKRML